ncbi:LamG-like jellyroll fold domain-containing protein [Botrimarina hoheduenensis]|uniref:LamG-like jellyroll fold domain-containing protein n=1 Tax=Botrimarina hoheduenensis TaxID=2528000 RepID=A0A5C5WA44_9BACT|nr:LamG-like jellyroll fold domain-containing protein [Botrimarina hoheduenensis]TWT46492.1 hypothetical protein Pla111_15880 [Botrimarina hoheduenensis]
MAIGLNGASYRTGPIAALPTSPPLTMACWFRAQASLSTTLISLSNSSLNDDYFQLGIRAENRVAAVVRDSAFLLAYAPGSFSLGEWCHAAGVYYSTTESVAAQDGALGSVLVKSETVPVAIDTVSLGALVRPTPIPNFQGDLAEVAIWSAALEPWELGLLAKGLRPDRLWSRRESLVLYRAEVRGVAADDRGPPLTEVGVPTVTRHSPSLGQEELALARCRRRPLRPAWTDAGTVTRGGVATGEATVAGSAAGLIGTLAAGGEA